MAIRVVAYDKSRFNSIEDALYEDSKNYQDANNPAIRYTNRRTGLNGDSFGAKTYNTIEEAQEEIDAWVSNASINGTDGLGWAILDGKTVISKSKKLSKSGRFNTINYQRVMPIDLDESEYNRVIGGEDSGVWFTDSINGRDFPGSAYYLPNENKLYHVYYDEDFGLDDVEQFSRLRHAFVYYDDDDDDDDDDYSASTKKSRMLSKSFNDMVKSIRKGEHLEKDANDFKVGDILVSSWGYDQTNVQWYQVVGVTSKSVKIREIKGRVQETGFMSGEAVPIPDAFTNNLWFGEQKTARVNSYGEVNITSDGRITAWKWDGNPEYVSWYA